MAIDQLENILLLSMVNASIVFTISETKIFRPFREWVKQKSEFPGEMLSCGYSPPY
jgi:hypothetical protein